MRLILCLGGAAGGGYAQVIPMEEVRNLKRGVLGNCTELRMYVHELMYAEEGGERFPVAGCVRSV